MAPTSKGTNGSGTQVRELVADRDRLRSWIDRLDSLDDATPQHIAARVREDYAERLAGITAELTEHVQAVRDDLRAARERLGEGEERHRETMDRLDEVRLRHRIGELDADSWEEQRPKLEAARDEADQAREEVAGEVETLEALLLEIEAPAEPAPSSAGEGEGDVGTAGPAAPEPPEAAGDDAAGDEDEWEPVIVGADDGDDELDAAFESFSGEDGENEPAAATGAVEGVEEDEDVALPWLSEIDEEIESATGAAAEREEAGEERSDTIDDEDDLAFLAELDRAIAASGEQAPNERGEPAEAPARHDGDAAGSAKGAEKVATIPCPECGAANDARSWYCEVCAAELG